MKRRSFLKLISMAAAAIALLKTAPKPEPFNSYAQPPRGFGRYRCVSCGEMVTTEKFIRVTGESQYWPVTRGHALPDAEPGTFAPLCRYADYSRMVDQANG